MSRIKNKEEKVKKILALKGKINDTELRKEIGKIFNVSKTRRQEIYNEIFGAGNNVPKSNIRVNGDTATVELNNAGKIKTLEELVKYCNIDTNEWRSKKFIANIWDSKLQVKAEFERKVSKETKKILEDLKDDLINHSPKVKKYKHSNHGNQKILEISLPDLHLGKLSWAPSCGSDYDSKIARELFFNALVEITQKALKYTSFERILFPIGNDYLNIDTEAGTTTAGTAQDIDSRFSKMFREGRKILVEAIDYLKTFAPIDIIVVPGNHDNTAMYHIGDSLECWYRNDENVTINNEPIARKYYQYGINLIGFCHGNVEKHDKLNSIMAVEKPDLWAATKTHEWHLAHLHHDWTREFMGCKVRVLPSLTANDKYHYDHGYVGNHRIGQGLIFDKQKGLDCIIQSTPIE